jgi:hypothetical protein
MPVEYDIAEYEVPDLELIATCLRGDEVVNGHGDHVDVVRNIQEFTTAFRVLVEHIKQRGKPPEGYVLFCPDFWHVAFGRAKCMPKEEGTILWDAMCVARDIGRKWEAEEHFCVRRYRQGGCELRFKQ